MKMKGRISVKRDVRSQYPGIQRVTVCGYKSITAEQSIDIRPLTILAGANSSGKSSIIQPLLLMKQTIEATYDPGALLLAGPNVSFSSLNQLLSRRGADKQVGGFYVGIELGTGTKVTTYFTRGRKEPVMIDKVDYSNGLRKGTLRPGMSQKEITETLPEYLKALHDASVFKEATGVRWKLVRERCFLRLELESRGKGRGSVSLSPSTETMEADQHLRAMIHQPGTRGNPERTYPVTAVGDTFPGTFERYVASVIAQWQARRKSEKLRKVCDDLERLGLTWTVTAKRLTDTEVELDVGRLKKRSGAREDLVSIADVGLGISQVLPVIVALRVAEAGQIVYLEHPETHLHPRAQVVMAEVLMNAAKRGIRVLAETHSSLLVLGVQALVAERRLPRELVALHWFDRGPDGATKVKSADLDEVGAFGDWPEDFGKVALETESRYLDAAEGRQKSD